LSARNVVFIFEFVYIVDYIDVFPYIEPSMYPWDEAYLITMDDCFDLFLDFLWESYWVFCHQYSYSQVFLETVTQIRRVYSFFHLENSPWSSKCIKCRISTYININTTIFLLSQQLDSFILSNTEVWKEYVSSMG